MIILSLWTLQVNAGPIDPSVLSIVGSHLPLGGETLPLDSHLQHNHGKPLNLQLQQNVMSHFQHVGYFQSVLTNNHNDTCIEEKEGCGDTQKLF